VYLDTSFEGTVTSFKAISKNKNKETTKAPQQMIDKFGSNGQKFTKMTQQKHGVNKDYKGCSRGNWRPYVHFQGHLPFSFN